MAVPIYTIVIPKEENADNNVTRKIGEQQIIDLNGNCDIIRENLKLPVEDMPIRSIVEKINIGHPYFLLNSISPKTNSPAIHRDKITTLLEPLFLTAASKSQPIIEIISSTLGINSIDLLNKTQSDLEAAIQQWKELPGIAVSDLAARSFSFPTQNIQLTDIYSLGSLHLLAFCNRLCLSFLFSPCDSRLSSYQIGKIGSEFDIYVYCTTNGFYLCSPVEYSKKSAPIVSSKVPMIQLLDVPGYPSVPYFIRPNQLPQSQTESPNVDASIDDSDHLSCDIQDGSIKLGLPSVECHRDLLATVFAHELSTATNPNLGHAVRKPLIKNKSDEDEFNMVIPMSNFGFGVKQTHGNSQMSAVRPKFFINDSYKPADLPYDQFFAEISSQKLGKIPEVLEYADLYAQFRICQEITKHKASPMTKYPFPIQEMSGSCLIETDHVRWETMPENVNLVNDSIKVNNMFKRLPFLVVIKNTDPRNYPEFHMFAVAHHSMLKHNILKLVTALEKRLDHMIKTKPLVKENAKAVHALYNQLSKLESLYQHHGGQIITDSTSVTSETEFNARTPKFMAVNDILPNPSHRFEDCPVTPDLFKRILTQQVTDPCKAEITVTKVLTSKQVPQIPKIQLTKYTPYIYEFTRIDQIRGIARHYEFVIRSISPIEFGFGTADRLVLICSNTQDKPRRCYTLKRFGDCSLDTMPSTVIPHDFTPRCGCGLGSVDLIFGQKDFSGMCLIRHSPQDQFIPEKIPIQIDSPEKAHLMTEDNLHLINLHFSQGKTLALSYSRSNGLQIYNGQIRTPTDRTKFRAGNMELSIDKRVLQVQTIRTDSLKTQWEIKTNDHFPRVEKSLPARGGYTQQMIINAFTESLPELIAYEQGDSLTLATWKGDKIVPYFPTSLSRGFPQRIIGLFTKLSARISLFGLEQFIYQAAAQDYVRLYIFCDKDGEGSRLADKTFGTRFSMTKIPGIWASGSIRHDYDEDKLVCDLVLLIRSQNEDHLRCAERICGNFMQDYDPKLIEFDATDSHISDTLSGPPQLMQFMYVQHYICAYITAIELMIEDPNMFGVMAHLQNKFK